MCGVNYVQLSIIIFVHALFKPFIHIIFYHVIVFCYIVACLSAYLLHLACLSSYFVFDLYCCTFFLVMIGYLVSLEYCLCRWFCLCLGSLTFFFYLVKRERSCNVSLDLFYEFCVVMYCVMPQEEHKKLNKNIDQVFLLLEVDLIPCENLSSIKRGRLKLHVFDTSRGRSICCFFSFLLRFTLNIVLYLSILLNCASLRIEFWIRILACINQIVHVYV